MKKARQQYGITPLTFCNVWANAYVDGKTLDYVVERLSAISGKKITRKYVLARASFYRNRGVVTLKSFAKRDRQQQAA